MIAGALLALAVGAPATEARAQRETCATQGKTVAANENIRVYTRGEFGNRAFFGCWLDTRRRYRLAEEPGFGRESPIPPLIALSGRYDSGQLVAGAEVPEGEGVTNAIIVRTRTRDEIVATGAGIAPRSIAINATRAYWTDAATAQTVEL